MLVHVALFFFAMWKFGGVVVTRLRHKRHHRTMGLLSDRAPAFADKVDCGPEECYGACDADGYADVCACREVVAGR
jgi:hypothetical protein